MEARSGLVIAEPRSRDRGKGPPGIYSILKDLEARLREICAELQSLGTAPQRLNPQLTLNMMLSLPRAVPPVLAPPRRSRLLAGDKHGILI
jgi:hypothetical protein